MEWFRERLIRLGIGYVRLDGTEEGLWREAMRHTPISYRWFGRSLSILQLDSELGDWSQWITARNLIEADDRIWPFVINPGTLAMRRGYVIVRKGKPIGGVVTEVS